MAFGARGGMTCGGFFCTKNALVALNVVYLAVAIVLIIVGAYAVRAGAVTSISVAGGVIAAGVFLFAVALLGVYGTARHSQVTLFFYIIILFLVFVVQFFVAVACLALSDAQIESLVRTGWKNADATTKFDAERNLNCCGLEDPVNDGVDCEKLPCFENNTCNNCMDIILQQSNNASQVAGGVGLFFSFTELFGFWLSFRFRNMQDPRYYHRKF